MFKQTKDPGFGEKYLSGSKRIINSDGSFNIDRRGTDANTRNMYQYLISMPWLSFLALLFSLYLIVNLAFACLYMAIGLDQLSGIGEDTVLSKFANAFFFSTQTLTTVGYGAISPVTALANFIASVEAFMGLAGFALMTGLLYGRFSKPSSKILYSNNAIIAPHNDGISLQFRVINQRHNVLMEMDASLLLATIDKATGNRKYYQLPLETSFIYFFPLNWTLVHKIDESSPIYGLSHNDLIDLDSELLILLKGFDDSFGQVVHSRHSYKADEIIYGAKFTKAYSPDKEGNVVIDVNKIHDFEKVALPEFERT